MQCFLKEDTAEPTRAETASQHLLAEELEQALASLTPRERLVIKLRYGIGDGYSHTLLEVGKELGVSHERARQLEARALKNMRIAYDRLLVPVLHIEQIEVEPLRAVLQAKSYQIETT